MVLALHNQFQWGYPAPLASCKACQSLPCTQAIIWIFTQNIVINVLSLQKYGKSDAKHENIQLFEFKINVYNIENASLIHLFAFYITAFNKSLC